MAGAKVNRVFKVSVIADDLTLYDRMKGGIFGSEFDKSYIQTQGANFGYTKVSVPESSEGYLMAQLWMLHPGKQWTSVRQIYYTGSSGLMLIVNVEKDYNHTLYRKLIREFLVVNKGHIVPMMVVGMGERSQENDDRVMLLVKDLERWSGKHVPFVSCEDQDKLDVLKDYILNIRNTRTKAKVLATLNMYFSLDSVSRDHRPITQILTHLRSLNIAGFFSLIPDDEMMVFIREVAAEIYFRYDGDYILYKRPIS